MQAKQVPVVHGDSTAAKRALGKAVARWMEQLETRQLMAMVGTDLPDYHFGETALITGREFAPNESVQLQITHAEGTPGSNDDPQNAPWVVQADAGGSIATTWAVNDPDAIRATYVLTARGMTSGETAAATFTDGPTDVQAWRNLASGANKWTSSTLNGSNSMYNEGEFIPFRFTDLNETPGSTHTVVLSYDFTNSQGVHMWDFIGSFNTTIPAADLTVGTSASGAASSWLIPSDTTLPPGTQSAGFLTTYNISSLSISGPTVVGEKKAYTITFTVASGGANKDIVIGFGGHLSREFTWGTNKGASDFPGGSGKVYASFDGSSDDNASLNPGQVVQDVNDPPVAVNDSVTTNEDTFIDIPVIANDTDVDTTNGSLLVSSGSIGNVVGGTAVLLPDNRTVRFTPSLNANNTNTPGGFSFTYRTSDGSLISGNEALVTVSVTPVNDPPVANPDSGITQEDHAITFTSAQLTANDTDIDNTAAQLNVTAVSNATNGTVQLSAGQITFTPALDFQGTAGFDYTVSDGAGGTATAHVTITVIEIDDPPVFVLTSGSLLYTENDGAVAIDPNLSLTDPDTTMFTGATIALTGYLAGQDVLAFVPQSGITGSFNAGTGVLTLSGSATIAQYEAALRSVTYTNSSEDPSSAARTATFAVSDAFNTVSASRGITVVPVNDAPINHLPPAQSTNEDTAMVLSASNGNAITISDVDAGNGIVQVILGVTNGTLTLGGTSGLSFLGGDGVADASMTFTGTITSINSALDGLTFAPALNYNGLATLSIITDDQGNSGTAGPMSDSDTLAITVNAINDAPVAQNDSVATDEDTPKQITLVATDIENSPLVYSIVDGPLHGQLVQDSNGVYTYTPDANYFGPDSFTFKANDGDLDSNIATVSITVGAVNDAPVTQPQNVTTPEDTPKQITLVASDIENSPLVYTIIDQPLHGTLNQDASGVYTYTPAANYFGPDSFTFRVNDGDLDSNIDTVTIDVTAVNDAPVAQPQIVNTPEDTAKQITLIATDIENSPLVYSIVNGPLHGQLVQDSNGVYTYTPDANYYGPDSFTFKANDGDLDSNVATVTINIGAVNDAPVAQPQVVITPEDTAKQITLVATDIENSPLIYSIVDGPLHGQLVQDSNGVYTYTPDANYYGPDSFTFKANDGDLDSNIATVSIIVTAVNDAPVAQPQNVVTPEDIAKQITLVATDIENSPLIYSIVDGPLHGQLVQDANGVYTYTPDANYYGPDSFTFKANDGDLDSNVATVTIDVTAVNDAPTANPQSVTTDEDTPKMITLTGADIDLDALVFKITSLPTNGALYEGAGTGGHLIVAADIAGGGYTLIGAIVTYLPSLDYFGGDTFNFVSNDAQVDSAPAAVGITVLDKTGPVITLGGSIGTETDAQTQSFNWNVTDPSGLGSVLVTIYKNGNSIFSTSAANGAYNFDVEGLGDYEITVSATDSVGNSSNASRAATVVDDDVDGPSILITGSQGSENDGQPQSFTWAISDPSDLSAISVVITQDGYEVYSSTNLANANNTFDFNSLGLGNFVINISATDNDGDRANDTVLATASRSVTVTDDDTTGPSIVLGGSIGDETDNLPQSFTWNISDPSGLSALSVIIRKDGSIIYQTQNLADAISSFAFDGDGLGVFTIDVEATDNDSDRAGDTATATASRSVTVTDDDSVAPVIDLNGSELTENDGQNQVFSWDVTDAGSGLFNVSVVIRQNGGIIHTSSLASGSFDFNSYGLGVFTLDVEATDTDSDRPLDSLTSTASRSVTVFDDDTTAPSIVLGGSTGSETDAATNHFTWNISDTGSGLGSISVIIRKDGGIIYQTTDLLDAVGSYNFDSEGLGVFTIDVQATDADDDRASDALTSTAAGSVTVSDDDIAPPLITLGGSQNTENDGQNQVFTWDVTDASLPLNVSVVIRQNGGVIHTSNLASGSFDFNSYGLGVFTIDVEATDADSDRTSDSLTSTDTRSVTVTDDDEAGPQIVLGGSQGTENDGQNQHFTWNATDPSGLSSISVIIKQDGNTIHTSSAASGDFDLNSFGLGVFTIDVEATDNDGDRAGDTVTSSATRSVTVVDDDTVGPVINLGGSNLAETDGATNHFTWNISDADSGLGAISIIITRDDGSGPVEILNTTTLADAIGSLNFDTLGLGTYHIAVSVTDSDADRLNDAITMTASRTVVVTDDDTTAPVIVLGGSHGTQTDGDDQQFTWNVLDAGSGLDSVLVTIKKNGSTIATSTDAAGSFDFNSYGLGSFTIEVQATDADNDRADDKITATSSQSVTVTDDDTTAPSIVLGGSTGSETDGANNHFTWDISDAGSGLGSISVIIRKDGNIIYQTQNLADAVSSYNFDSDGLGVFTIDVEATDADNDRASDAIMNTSSRSVTVTDDDEAGPIITLNGSQNTETDGQQQVFTWNVSDVSGLSSVSVVITKDGNPIHTSSAAGGSFDFDGHGLGVFEITVTAIDNDSDRANDKVTSIATRSVTVIDDDIDAPSIILGGSEGVETDGQTNYFTWNVTDGGSGIGELSVIVRRNGVIIYETDDVADAVGSFNFDTYGLGSYTLNVVAVDADGDRSEDSLSSADARVDVVEDDDTALPVILLGGSEGTETDGQNQFFTWDITDASGLSLISVVVTRNGSQIFASSDLNGSFNFNSDGLGDYQIAVQATDADNDRALDSLTATASRSVTVNDDDTLGPSIVLGGSIGNETDNLPQSFTWNISDPSGLSALSVIIRKDGSIIYQTQNLADAIGSFGFDGEGLGVFTIDVEATDNDDDRAGDTSTATASRSVTVTDDDTAAPVIVIGGSSGSETDAATNHFTWSITDGGSGLASLSVIIKKNGGTIYSTSSLLDATGSYNFDSEGPGNYEIFVSATDADSDRPLDALSSNDSAAVVVSDDDTAKPVINLGGSHNTENDGLNQNFTWDVSDVSGLAGVTVSITKNGNLIQSFNTANGSFDFNSLGLGTYEVTVNATDNDIDWTGDQLSESATRTVVVEDDDTAMPVINLGGSSGSERDGVDNHFTWNVSDFSGFASLLVTVKKNGSSIFTSSAASGDFDLNTLGLGDYEIIVEATDNDTDWTGDQMSNSMSRSVTVTDDDTIAPSIVLGGSTGNETDGDANHFTWNVSDASNLLSLTVTIKRNGVIVHETINTGDASDTFNFDSLGLGTYEMTVSATDADQDWAGDTLSNLATRTVVVSDDDIDAPVIDLQGSSGFENDGQNQNFSWNVTDLSGLNNVLITIKHDGNTVQTFNSAGGNFDFNTLGLGTFEISVEATDDDNDRTNDRLFNSASRSVTVTDDDLAGPIITLGGSTADETDGQPQSFTWNITDGGSGIGSLSVIIRKNGAIIYQTTNLADVSGSFPFDTDGLGVFTIDVEATDADADRANDAITSTAARSVTVTDDDTIAPTIILGGSQNSETDGDTNHFTWDVSDLSGLSNVSITITQDGNPIHTSAMATGSFNFDSYGLGHFEIAVNATDADNDRFGDMLSNQGSRSVDVSDDDTVGPTIVLGGSQGAENDDQNQFFTWNVSDISGLSSVLVTIKQNGSAVDTFTAATGNFDFNTLGLGTFEIIVDAIDNDADRLGDTASNSMTRTVVVEDDDITPPQIVLGGSQGSQTDGQTQFFTWTVTDGGSGLGSVSVVIRQDGSIIHTSSAASGSFSFDTFGLGVFTIDVEATDADNDRTGDAITANASRNVTVTDDDSAAPVINLNGSQGTQHDGQNQFFDWAVVDSSGLSSVSVTIKQNGSTIFTSNSGGTFDFNSYGLGTFELIVSATDADSDRPGDSISDTQTRTVIVTDDDSAIPAIVLGGSQNTENDGANQNFTWDVSDASGLASVNVTIRKNGGVIQSYNTANGNFDFNSLGLGTYEIEVSATDNDTDWAGDQLPATMTRTVTVTDDDIAGPVINILGSTGGENDGQTQSLAWTITDSGSGLALLSITITRNGATIFSTTDLAQANSSFNFDSYGLGDYAINISATDNDTDWTGDQLTSTASRDVTVTDDDITVPTIVLGGSQGAETDHDNQSFNWNVSDASGLQSVQVTITQDGNVIDTFTNSSGNFNFNSYGLGTFEITVQATDNDDDRAGDRLSTSMSRTVTVTDDDDAGPSIVLGGSHGNESHGVSQFFTWNVTDPSGLSDAIVTIKKNGNVIHTGNAAGGNFNFDSQGDGTYVIEVSSTDDDNDRGNDKKSNSASRQVEVTNSNPFADAGADQITNEGTSVGFNGNGSSDVDGDSLQYFWDFGDGSTGVGIAPVHTYADNGDYVASLKVTDGFGGEHTDTMNVKVNNVAPTPQIAGATTTPEGTMVMLSSSFTDPGVNDTHTYNWHVVAGNGQVIADGSGSTFSFTPNDNGTYNVTLSVTDDDGGVGQATHAVFASNVAPIANAAYADGVPVAKQYSDFVAPIFVIGTDPSTADILSSHIVSGLPADSGLSVTFDAITRTGSLTGKANLAPGTYNATVRVSDDDGGIGEVIVPIIVTQEDAVSTYTGTAFTATPASSSIATVTLRATIQDITAVSPGLDPNAGDIRNARVTFINRDTNTVIAANLPVTLLDASDPKSGFATYNWSVDIGSNISQSFTIGIIVTNYYTRDSAADNTVVTVSKPLEGFITGGGYFTNTRSAGWLSGEVGQRTNFGFNVKYTKSGNNLQGNVNIIVRSYQLPNGTRDTKLHVYQIKSTAINWLATQKDPLTGKRYAAFNAKCNVQDITNPKNVISVAGGLVLEMTMTDAGEPGSTGINPDSIGFTVWKGSDLWYSSNWDGSRTVEDILGGGNVQVHDLQGTRK